MTRLVFQIARPVTLWSLHFIAIYALISAACAPRGLLEIDLMRAIAVLATLAAIVPLVVWLLQARRRVREIPPKAEPHALATAVFWSALISLAAILANLAPVAFLSSCGG